MEWNGITLSIELDRLANQADGAVLARYGGTVVLCTAVIKKADNPDRGFLPLVVNFVERSFAAGKIPGSYFRREGKPTEKEILTSRLIDRTLRPMLPADFCDDIQIICTLMSHDKKCDPDIVALIGAGAALALAGAPMSDIIAACRIGCIGGELTANPSLDVMNSSTLDLVVSCSDESVIMIESEAQQIPEDKMMEAIKFAHENCKTVLEIVKELVKECGKQRLSHASYAATELQHEIADLLKDKLIECYSTISSKRERSIKIKAIQAQIESEFVSEVNTLAKVRNAIDRASRSILREYTLSNNLRVDGRSYTDVRPIGTEINVLPKECVHGSALFQRGETQALAATTLGSGTDEQSIETLEYGCIKEHFMLHYNFPPYCVGEVEPLRGTSRREVGHGKLASKAIRPLLPSKEEFPYTIRVVSEILSCYGSSSMATVCATSMSLMATGVPITNAVSGVAMGLIKTDNKYAVLTDITGDEDHFGDMDFKVAGTANGLTALQLDIKISGLSHDIIRDTLLQARDARHYILEQMNAVIPCPAERNEHAPQIIKLNVPVSKIAEIIGKGGAMIKSICEKSGCQVSVESDGLVKICAVSKESGQIAVSMIEEIITDITDNSIHYGKIERIIDCGAIITLPGGRSGMVHISQISDTHVGDINDFLAVGQTIKVIVLDGSDQRRIRLSMKHAKDNNNNEDGSESINTSARSGYGGNSSGSRSSSSRPWKANQGSHGNRGGGNRRHGGMRGDDSDNSSPRNHGSSNRRNDDFDGDSNMSADIDHGNFFASLGSTDFNHNHGGRSRDNSRQPRRNGRR